MCLKYLYGCIYIINYVYVKAVFIMNFPRTVNGTSNDGLKSKPGPKRPRRKFPWNEEFRYNIIL